MRGRWQVPLCAERRPAAAGLGHPVGGVHVPAPGRAFTLAVHPHSALQPESPAPGAGGGYEEGAAGRQRGAISGLLAGSWRDTLVRGEQAILFLNRRGASRMVFCGECGQVPECPRCSVQLTYHSANGRLMCHHCGLFPADAVRLPRLWRRAEFYRRGYPEGAGGAGAAFPGVEVLRMDSDTVSAARPTRPFWRIPAKHPHPGWDPDGGQRAGL